MPTGVVAHPLRALTVEPQFHPRGQRHLSAASGLVCAHDRAYVISDDEHHLAVFRDRESPGELHRILPRDLPHAKRARKRLKPDLETLLLVPSLLPLRADGEPSRRVRRFDLQPLYQPLRACLGEINIEGAMVIGDELVLLHRGVAGLCANASARYLLRDLLDVIDGKRSRVSPPSIRHYSLGAVDGVPLAFTDGAALPDGGWIFSAVAEDTADSYTDGRCHGSALGVVSPRGDLLSVCRLSPPVKVEGIDVGADGRTICMVTDADDPAQSSWLLKARL